MGGRSDTRKGWARYVAASYPAASGSRKNRARKVIVRDIPMKWNSLRFMGVIPRP
jgi:hypothetical protein